MEPLRLGIVGLDTSHCVAFTQLLHNAAHPHHVPGAVVAAAFPGGSQGLALSRNRVEGFTRRLADEFGVRIVDSIEDVGRSCDAVLLESVDGRQHLEQFAALAPFGKPVFIDKPLCTKLQEAREILDMARRHGAPVMSCSSLRYSTDLAALGQGEVVEGCEAFGPSALLDDFPGYFWYGIHGVEILFAKMGRGAVEVKVAASDRADVITGRWRDGRIGTVYAHRIEGLGAFGCTVFTRKGAVQAVHRDQPPAYGEMLRRVLEFFRTRQSAIPAEETLEIIAFIEAANESRDSGRAIAVEA